VVKRTLAAGKPVASALGSPLSWQKQGPCGAKIRFVSNPLEGPRWDQEMRDLPAPFIQAPASARIMGGTKSGSNRPYLQPGFSSTTATASGATAVRERGQLPCRAAGHPRNASMFTSDSLKTFSIF